MRKTVPIILGAVLIAGSTVQVVAAAERHARTAPYPRASSSAMPTTLLRVVRALFAARSPEIPTTRRLITKGGPPGVS